MQKKRLWLAGWMGCAAVAACGVAAAAGLGAGDAGAVLGHPLDFAVQVRMDPGTSLAADCVSAEVMLGDRRLPSTQVRTAVEPQGGELFRVRVLTAAAVDEPVVAIQLHAGCSIPLTRRYVVLADPPQSGAATPAAPALAAPAAEALPLADAADPPRAAEPVAAGMTRSVALARPAAMAAVTPAAMATATAVASGSLRRVQQGRTAPLRDPPPRRARRAPTLPAPAPRLTLEAAGPEPDDEAAIVEQAIAAVAEAASAARAAASAASAAAERIAGLERTVDQLRGDAKGNRELVGSLRQRLAAAEDERWLGPLAAAVLLLALLAAWLGWRLRAVQRERQAGWDRLAGAALASPPLPGKAVGRVAPDTVSSKLATLPIPFVTSEVRLPNAPPTRPRVALPAGGSPPWPPPAPPDSWQTPAAAPLPAPVPPTPPAPAPPAPAAADHARTEVLPHARAPELSAPRDVSIDELLDLEQQAEFFVVLGQDESAIELLVEHLRQTGGGSPLAYLKLLEIHRRRSDRSDYERLRVRFNQRFNAYAPDWGVDLQAGRSLDDYAGAIPRLQQVWARPLDAMAELEALLFRKSRGDLFDLPAYREVLFLYSLARDLLDREAVDTGLVDLLLPLADGSEFGTTAPAPHLDLGPADFGRGHPRDGQPTAPIDFDLSVDGGRPASIFDPLDKPPPSRHRS